MKIVSDSFGDQQSIPNQFTCDGDNISPDLKWEEVPEETKSFALSCLDPDASSGEFAHWLLINIPKETREFKPVAQMPEGAVEVDNDFGYGRYGGPCPPSGTHRYIFTIYALNVEKLEGVTRDNFNQKVGEHMIESAELIGLYSRE